MKIQIDLKSVFLGLATGVGAMFLLGDATNPGINGRYQVSSAANFVTIVDTKTGEAWGHNAGNDGDNDKSGAGRFWDAKER